MSTAKKWFKVTIKATFAMVLICAATSARADTLLDSYTGTNSISHENIYSYFPNLAASEPGNAASFTTPNDGITHHLDYVNFKLCNCESASANGNMHAILYDEGGVHNVAPFPTGSPISTSDAVSLPLSLSTSYTWVSFPFSSSPALTPNHHYMLVFYNTNDIDTILNIQEDNMAPVSGEAHAVGDPSTPTWISNNNGSGNSVFTLFQAYESAGPPPPPPPPSGISGLIASADTAFSSTTGFTVTQLADDFQKDMIVSFLGSALALISYLAYWNVAILIISICVFIAYRAFRFFRH